MTYRFPRLLLTTFLIVIAMPLVAFAGAKQRGGGSTMDWDVSSTGHEKATLTWSCADGEVGSAEFKNGKRVSLSVSDLGSDVADGACSWELRLTPKVSSDVAKKLADARAANDDKAARKAMKDAGFDPDSMVMSGSFSIQNGMFVSTDGVESDSNDSAATRRISTDARPSGPIAVNDQVIPDDLIVQASLCVGFDCVNGESFGFDTIRLKENNTRIKAEDTSVGTFPTNDWQLTFNDSASGGASKFSVEDITGSRVPFTIEAGATTNSVFVDSTGRVGFRTSTPVLDAHIATSNTPGIRLEQNNTGGFTAQTWDIAGNEANFFVRDVTGGSLLPFRIRPGAPTSSVDISADGDVGIGTGSPNNAKLDVSSSTQAKPRILLSGQEFFQAANTSTDGVALLLGVNRASNRQLWIADSSALTQNTTNRVFRINPNVGDLSALATDGATTKFLTLNNAGGFVGIATTAPGFPLQVGDAAAGDGNGAHVTTGGVWTNGSSREFKKNIADLSSEEAKAAVNALKPVRYEYKAEPGEEYVGFIAEDVPSLVAVGDRHYLSPMDIVATLTKVVQDQQKTIDELSKKVEELSKTQQQ
jgi:hypothetical protein